MNSIGGVSGIGAPLPPNRIGGDNFIRYIGDRLILDFHEGAGTTVRDLSGNGNDGTFKAAGEPAWERGRVKFDGTNDYIDCGNDTALSPRNITIETQVQVTGNADAHRYVICKNDTVNNEWQWTIDNTNGFRPHVYTDPSGLGWASGSLALLNSWYLFVETYDAAIMFSYLDGLIDTETSINEPLAARTTEEVRIGIRGNDTYPFKGLISFIRINASAFSANQVLAEYLWNKWRS